MIHLSLNSNAVVLTTQPGGCYEITHDVLPDGVWGFGPIGLVVAWYGSTHYELMGYSGGQRLFRYNEPPCPIRDRWRGIGPFAAIASVPRHMDHIHQIAPNVPDPQAQIHPTPEANRGALRRNAKLARPTIMEARRPESVLPDFHSVGEMDTPCKHCGALRWPGRETRKSTRCSGGRDKLPDILESHGPLKSLLGWADAGSADFHRIVRIYNSILSFASVGSHCDIPTMNRPGSFAYRIHGSNYHAIGTVENKEGDAPNYSQIYLYDKEEAKTAREAITNPPMRRETLSGARDMMAKFNPFARLFVDCDARMRTSGIEEMRMALRAADDRLDSRRYNAPSAPEIAAIIAEESEGGPMDISLSLREGGFSEIADTHQRYDPLEYALIHPRVGHGRSLGASRELGA